MRTEVDTKARGRGSVVEWANKQERSIDDVGQADHAKSRSNRSRSQGNDVSHLQHHSLFATIVSRSSGVIRDGRELHGIYLMDS
jgi:hypothetical protein